MGEPAMTTTTQQERVVNAIEDLAIAYFDRMAATDYPRAGVVLSVFADTFNRYRADLVARLQPLPAVVRRLPATLQPFFDTVGGSSPESAAHYRMREVLGVALGLAGVQPATYMAIPQVAVGLGGWWMGVLPQIEPLLTAHVLLSQRVAGTPMGSLQQLSPFIESFIQTGTGNWARPAAPTPLPEPTVPPPVQTPAPLAPTTQGGDVTFNVPGTVSRFVMPTWGWWAIGVGVVAAAGVITWGVVDQGWFDTKAKISAPSKGRRRGR